MEFRPLAITLFLSGFFVVGLLIFFAIRPLLFMLRDIPGNEQVAPSTYWWLAIIVLSFSAFVLAAVFPIPGAVILSALWLWMLLEYFRQSLQGEEKLGAALKAVPSRISLTGARWFTHFLISLIWFGASVVLLFKGLTDPNQNIADTIPLVFSVLAIASMTYMWKAKFLRFTIIETPNTAMKNYESIVELAKSKAWTVSESYVGKLIEVHADEPLLANWEGTMITVRFFNSYVYVNSICDPDGNASDTSNGRNKRNVSLVRESVAGS